MKASKVYVLVDLDMEEADVFITKKAAKQARAERIREGDDPASLIVLPADFHQNNQKETDKGV